MKKLLPFFAILILSLSFLSSCAPAGEGELLEPPETVPRAVEIIPEFMLLPGSYIAGVNISEGEYVLTATGAVKGYFELSGGESFVFGSFDRQYVMLREGEELFFRDSVLLLPSNAPLKTDAAGGFMPGMYKVGAHIPEGNYTFVPMGVSDYFVTKNPLYDFDYVLTGTVSEPVILYLTAGQYITLSGGSLRFNG